MLRGICVRARPRTESNEQVLYLGRMSPAPTRMAFYGGAALVAFTGCEASHQLRQASRGF
jgi:hypothetical protein